MKITIVTDHRFYKVDDTVYDDYVFDYSFFCTYLKVFENVEIVARVREEDNVRNNWSRSSGKNVSFIEIPDIHGINWLLRSSSFFRRKESRILDTNCLCFRIPSHAAWEVYHMNKENIPYMFEAIGDPKDAMVSSNNSVFKMIFFKIVGKILEYRKRKIVNGAITGSYVSVKHLQQKYPVRKGVLTESVSSIRLSAEKIIDHKVNFDFNKLKIIHVGSFIPLKNQKDLIHLVKLLKDNAIPVSLMLVGEGPLRKQCELLSAELGVSDLITFTGQVTGFDNIVKKLDEASVFILPSSNEGMPRSLIEAMARGLICIGSNTGGIAELLPQHLTFSLGKIPEMFDLLLYIINLTDKEIEEISQSNIIMAKEFEAEKLEAKRVKILTLLKNFTECQN